MSKKHTKKSTHLPDTADEQLQEPAAAADDIMQPTRRIIQHGTLGIASHPSLRIEQAPQKK